MACSSNLEMIMTAAGRDGTERAQISFDRLLSHWIATPEARRTVLHAAQIYERARGQTVGQGNGPWTLPMFLGPFQAAVVLCLYSVLHPYCTDQDPQVFELASEVDWPAVGAAGMGGVARDEENAASRWILHGQATDSEIVRQLQLTAYAATGGSARIANTPLSSVRSRVAILLSMASFIDTQASRTRLSLGRIYASILRRWIDCEFA